MIRFLVAISVLLTNVSFYAQSSFIKLYEYDCEMDQPRIMSTRNGYFLVSIGDQDKTWKKERVFLNITRLNSSGEVEWNKSVANYVRSWNDLVVSSTSDEGMILAISTGTGFPVAEDEPAIHLIKLDAKGGILWNNLVHTSRRCEITSVIQTRSGGYLATAKLSDKVINTGSTSKVESILVSFSSTGEITWSRVYNSPHGGTICTDICETRNGQYLLLSRGFGNDAPISYTDLSKLDKNGNIISSKRYGHKILPHNMVVTSGGEIILSGNSRLYTGTETFFVSKMDSTGAPLWVYEVARKKGEDLHDRIPEIIVSSEDGSVMMAGTRYSASGPTYIYWLKISGKGELIWARILGGKYADHIHSFIQTSDKGFLITAMSNLPVPEGEVDIDALPFNILLMKTDAEKMTSQFMESDKTGQLIPISLSELPSDIESYSTTVTTEKIKLSETNLTLTTQPIQN